MERDYLLAQLRKKSYGESLSGREVIPVYLDDEKKKGYTWFDTDSPVNEATASQCRTALFMVDGQIAYRADIMEIHSYNEARLCPAPGKEPKEWKNEKARTWMKLRNLRPENEITVNRLQITSSGNALEDVVLRRCLSYVSLR